MAQDEVISRIVDTIAGEEGHLRQAEYTRTWGKVSALLRAKLAFYHLMKVWGYWSDDPVASVQQAERLAQEALSAPALPLAYYLAGDDERSVQAALQIDPDSIDRDILLASAYVRLGQMDEARAATKRLLELEPNFTQDNLKENFLYSDPSILQRQATDLGKAGLPET